MNWKVWCLGWNQWRNLLPLADRCWLRWCHCTRDEPYALYPNKNNKKLCNNGTETNKGQDGNNLSYKFDYIWKWLIHNIILFIHNYEIDICGDDKTWAASSYGESGDGIIGQSANKLGITKGGHTVLVSDVHHTRPGSYRHIQKFHVKPHG